MTTLCDLDTPAALVDTRRMQHNIRRMQERMDALGVRFRPHVKTSKCLPVVQAQVVVRIGHRAHGLRDALDLVPEPRRCEMAVVAPEELVTPISGQCHGNLLTSEPAD